MLTQLATVKARLGLADIDTTYDDQLTRVIQAVSTAFEDECQRDLGREAEAVYEFPADELQVPLPCYPVERVIRLEDKTDEINGWVAQPTVRFVLRRQCILVFPEPIGSYLESVRVVYTGGYVLPGTAPSPGQDPLPADLEHATVEQVACWFQNRDRLGLTRAWEYHGLYRQFHPELGLLPSVKTLLGKYRRWRV